MKLYTVTDEAGQSQIRKGVQFSLPQGEPRSPRKPGEWVSGGRIHITGQPVEWMQRGSFVWEVEAVGVAPTGSAGEYVAEQVRILREHYEAIPTWWRRGEIVHRHIEGTRWFSQSASPDPAWCLFDTREQAYDTALSMPRKLAIGGYNDKLSRAESTLAVGMLRQFGYEYSWIGGKFHSIYGLAALSAARERMDVRAPALARTTTIAQDATLLAESLALDCNISPELQEAREYMIRRWSVYARGYGLLADVDGTFFVYRQLTTE